MRQRQEYFSRIWRKKQEYKYKARNPGSRGFRDFWLCLHCSRKINCETVYPADSMIRVLSVLLFVLVLLILLLLLVLLVLLVLLIVFRLLHEWSPPKISDEEISKSLDTSMARRRPEYTRLIHKSFSFYF